MRTNQKARTRQAIVRATGALLRQGQKPTLEEIAELAQVSRATAYRYFPGLDALLSEAAVDLMLPDVDDLLGPSAPGDAFERLALVDETFDKACREQEVPLRLMLAKVLETSIGRNGDEPLRQNRRVPMLVAALAPLEARLGKAGTRRLAEALALVVGTEGFLALNDVVGLDRDEARDVRRWVIDSLVSAALAEADG
ncbi:TetR family transcriptional regulator [Altererythrobacter salegens]|uniref:TetR family transcriptional regulator n=1 Tax=Croceibacterium salegens TaxID=1737568 RepID=A0A6I4SWE2_9SPHN|nr:TetR/AcrR family transcriptional regulator [Croceibacterium salegens]MXO60321.1 TetR family transcriptional regulator [Croceibacterium salegens]